MTSTTARDDFKELDMSEAKAAEVLGTSRTRFRKALDADPAPRWVTYCLMGLEEDINSGNLYEDEKADFTECLNGDRWSDITARQAIPILVECARNRQTITYKELDRRLREAHPERGASGMLTKYGYPLGRISFACEDIRRASIENEDPAGHEEMPPLTAIVVRADTEMPGDGFPLLVKRFFDDVPDTPKRKNLDAQIEFTMERIYDYEGWDFLVDLAAASESEED